MADEAMEEILVEELLESTDVSDQENENVADEEVAFINDPKLRQQYDRRSLASMHKKLDKWYAKTRCPVFFLGYSNGKICYSGPPHMKALAEDEEFMKKFYACATQPIPPARSTAKDVNENCLPLDPDWGSLNIYGKRQLLTALVTQNGAKRARWNDVDAMPHWWPKNIRFRDPNNGKPKMKLWEFNLIIKAYQEKLPMGDDDLQSTLSSSLQTQTSPLPACAPPTAPTPTPPPPAPTPTPSSPPQSSPSPEPSSPLPPSSPPPPSTSPHEQSFSSRPTIEALWNRVHQACWDDDDASSILLLLRDISDWESLVECCHLLHSVMPSPDHRDTQLTCISSSKVEMRVRHCLPEEYLRDGLEPAVVRADGNCLFNSISLALYKDEYESNMLKLGAVVQGCIHEQVYINKIMTTYPPEAFIQTVTTDAILASINHIKKASERMRAIYRKEVMATLTDGRYSGLLQVHLVAGYIEMRVHSICSEPGYDLYNTEVLPLFRASRKGPSLKLLWCRLHQDAVVANHIAPVLPCTDSLTEFNTFAENVTGKCSSSCQIKECATASRLVQCEHCLIWFHCKCIGFLPGQQSQLPQHWFCGCALSDEYGWLTEFQDKLSLRRLLCSKELSEYLQRIADGSIASLRRDLFVRSVNNVATAKKLRSLAGFGPNHEDTYLEDVVLALVKARSDLYFPPGVPLDEYTLLHYCLQVAITEVVIWIIARMTKVSRVMAEKMFSKHHDI